MQKISNKEKKAYNRQVEKYNSERERASGAAPFVIIVAIISAFYLHQIGDVGKCIAGFCVIYAMAVAIGLAVSNQDHFNRH